MQRVILCRFAAPNAKGILHPTIATTPEFTILRASGCSAHYYSPPANTLAEGSPVLVILHVPDAQAAALAPTIAALDDNAGVRVLPNLRGTQTLSGSQRTAVRAILNSFSINGTEASQTSTDFGDFLRYILVNAWQNTGFDKAKIT